MKNYNEHIYSICDNVDYNDQDSIVDALSVLAKEALGYEKVVRMYEQEFKKIVTAEQFENIARKVAKSLLEDTISGFEDEEVKQYALNNIDEVMDMLY